jgi:tripartite-type tricarboxylate transporter receptor subunit TctC
MKSLILVFTLFLAAYGFTFGGRTTQAQPYPNHPIQMVIPLPPGAQGDVSGRLLADEIGRILNTQIVVVNKVGATSTLGTEAVARAKKDGYTILYTSSGPMSYLRITYPEMVHYDPDKDLEPLGTHLFYPATATVLADSPWKTFAELVDYGKKNPGKLRVSTTGVGSSDHFNVEIIHSLTGAEFTHVPFKGGESVLTALLGGHVEVTFDTLSKVLPHIESGKLRPLIISKKRPELPNVPTLEDLGYKEELISAWFGFYAPSGITEEVRKALVSSVEKAINHPGLKEKTEKLGFNVEYKSPAESRKLAQEYTDRAKVIIDKLGIKH